MPARSKGHAGCVRPVQMLKLTAENDGHQGLQHVVFKQQNPEPPNMKGTPMNYRLGTLGLIAAMVLSLPSFAQDEEGTESTPAADGAKAKLARKLYVSPMFNYLKAADSRGTKNGLGGQIAIGKSVTNGLNLELVSQYLTADPKTGDGKSAQLKGVGLGAMVFPLNSLPDLYVPLSIMRGQVNDNPGPIADYSTTFFDIGLGYLIGLGDTFKNTSIRAEVRYRTDAHGRESAGIHTGERKAFYEGVAALGVLIPLGAEPVAAPAEVVEETAVVPVETGDSDGDGVTDDKDQCPDTPAGTTVDETGCPLPAPAPEPTCNPPNPGEPIDLNGCKAGDAIVLKGVTFEVNSSRLTPNAKTILDTVADALLAKQDIKAELGGYTSSEGSDSSNQALSERRAESVKAYLVGRGVDAARLEPKGYGEASPVADNETPEGRELNRRVELKVTDSGAAPAVESAPVDAPAEAAPIEGEAAATEETAPAEGETALAEEAAPAEAETAPAEGTESAPATDAEAAPATAAESTPDEVGTSEPAPEGDNAPAETPVEGEAAPAEEAPAEAEAAPEVENAQPAQ